MSFFDEIKTEIQTEQNQKSNLAEQASAAQASQAASEPAPTTPVLPERMSEFVQEELKTLQETIRQDARSGKYQTVGGKHLFDGTRLWHEGDYRQGTALLANFYPFLSRDRMQEKEILTQSKRLFSGYRYEVRYTLSKDGAFYFNYFKEEMKTLLPGWKNLVAEAMKEELPVPAFSSALNYFYSLTSADLPANLVQAQRDYFGAHTFERKDELRGQFFHENWTGHGGDTKSGTYNV